MQLRYFLGLLLLSLFSNLSAQCPGCVISLPELPEDTVYLSAPAAGEVGTYYDQDLSFRMPKTTATVDDTFDPPLNINNITITSLSGLPPGVAWEANQTEFDPQEETDGCVKFCGTPLVAGTYPVTVSVDAQVSIFTQSTSFDIIILIEPANTDTEGFTMTNNIGCGEASVEFTNNIASDGAEGFSYFWDFGNGETSSAENPGTVVYSEPGTYTVAYEAVIDTSGYFLTGVNLEASDCDDLIGTADFYLRIFDPNGTEIYTSETVSSDPPIAYSIPPIALEGGNYTIQVFDDDPLAQVDCGSVNFSFTTSGTLIDNDLELSVSIINPTSTISSEGEVTVYALPEAPQISPDGVNDICEGESVSLQVEDFNEIQWYMGETLLIGETNPILNVQTSGNYSVVYTSQEGCSSISEEVSVEFLATPEVPNFSFNENELAVVNPEELPSDYSLQWYFEGEIIVGATDLSICMDETGTGDYRLVVTDNETGCTNAYEQYQVFLPNVGCALSSLNNVEVAQISIAPNPAHIFIQLSDLPAEVIEVKLSDIQGRLVKTEVINSSSPRIYVQDLVDGVYILQAQTNTELFTGKFVKE